MFSKITLIYSLVTIMVFTFLTTYLYADSSASKNEYVAKVLMMRGTVKVVDKDSGTSSVIKVDDRVAVGSIVKTAEKSFAKLLFIDKSQMTVGPSSEMNVTEFSKDKPGIISLIKGQLRSQVVKNYMDKNGGSSEENKLFIKTQTAAMGVRGTDFQTIYNPTTEMTSVITFEGAVKMVQLDNIEKERVTDYKTLELVVNSEKSVTVTEGQFAGANPKQEQVSIPVKISPAQLESMKSNSGSGSGASTGATTSESGDSNKKTFGSPIPPGVPSKVFVNTESTKSVEKQLGGGSDLGVGSGNGSGASIGGNIANKMGEGGPKAPPPPEGFFDKGTGAFAPPAGGFIDVQTGFYLPPPPGSAFDANTGVYVPPPTVGKFDPATGNYVPPQGLKLNESGQFVKVEMPSTGMMRAGSMQTGGPIGGPSGPSGPGTGVGMMGPGVPGQGPKGGGPMMGSGSGVGVGVGGIPGQMQMPGQMGMPGGMPGSAMMGMGGANINFIPQVLNFGADKAPMFMSPNDPMNFAPMRMERVFNDPSNPNPMGGPGGPYPIGGMMGPYPGMAPYPGMMGPSESMLYRIENTIQKIDNTLQTLMQNNTQTSTTQVKVMIDLTR